MLLPPWLALLGAHRPVGEGAVVERAEIDGLGVVVDAGHQHGEGHRAARLQRELGDAVTVDDLAAVGAAGFEQGRLGRDVHRLGQADAELHVDGRDLTDLEPHVLADVLLEAAHLHRQGVETGTQEGKGVGTFGVRDGRRDFVGVLVLDGHGGAWQCGVTRVGDLTFDGGAEFLRACAADRGQDQRTDRQKKRASPQHRVPPAAFNDPDDGVRMERTARGPIATFS